MWRYWQKSPPSAPKWLWDGTYSEHSVSKRKDTSTEGREARSCRAADQIKLCPWCHPAEFRRGLTHGIRWRLPGNIKGKLTDFTGIHGPGFKIEWRCCCSFERNPLAFITIGSSCMSIVPSSSIRVGSQGWPLQRPLSRRRAKLTNGDHHLNTGISWIVFMISWYPRTPRIRVAPFSETQHAVTDHCHSNSVIQDMCNPRRSCDCLGQIQSVGLSPRSESLESNCSCNQKNIALKSSPLSTQIWPTNGYDGICKLCFNPCNSWPHSL